VKMELIEAGCRPFVKDIKAEKYNKKRQLI
jgi:hypothetical protein